MRISYRFDENDFLNPQSYLRKRELFSWLMLECMIFMGSLLIGGIVYFISREITFSLFLFLMVILFLNLIIFILFWMVLVYKLKSARRNRLFGWIHMTFTDKGIHIVRSPDENLLENYQSDFQDWSEVKKIRESKDYFFLSLGWGREMMIPKRAFSSEEDINHFRKMVVA